jgi:hypothetical protein
MSPQKRTVMAVAQAAGNAVGCDHWYITSSNQCRPVAMMRQVTAYILHEHYDYHVTAIAEAFQKNRTSIIHCVRMVRDRAPWIPEIWEAYSTTCAWLGIEPKVELKARTKPVEKKVKKAVREEGGSYIRPMRWSREQAQALREVRQRGVCFSVQTPSML